MQQLQFGIRFVALEHEGKILDEFLGFSVL